MQNMLLINKVSIKQLAQTSYTDNKNKKKVQLIFQI